MQSQEELRQAILKEGKYCIIIMPDIILAGGYSRESDFTQERNIA